MATSVLLMCGCSSIPSNNRELSLKPSAIRMGAYTAPYWTRVRPFAFQTGAQDGESDAPDYTAFFTEADVAMMAKILAVECPSVPSTTEQACVAWTICNRVDAGYGTLEQVMTAPNQFAYYNSTEAPSHLYDLAEDVLIRWSREKSGQQDVGRVLPSDYMWFSGDGRHNYFRNQYQGGEVWTYSLPTPYES